MIKGPKKKDYNTFEEELNELLGSFQSGDGITYHFHQLHETFSKSEQLLITESTQYLEQFEKEVYEIKKSIIDNDPEHSIKAEPLYETLRKAYFITVHSEFESTFEEIITIYNKYFPSRPFGKLSDEFITHQDFDSSRLLDGIILANRVLVSYNYIRNKIVHQKAKTNSPQFQSMMLDINSGKISHLKIETEDISAKLFIENIEFIKNYIFCITKFVQDLIDSSYNNRQHIS